MVCWCEDLSGTKKQTDSCPWWTAVTICVENSFHRVVFEEQPKTSKEDEFSDAFDDGSVVVHWPQWFCQIARKWGSKGLFMSPAYQRKGVKKLSPSPTLFLSSYFFSFPFFFLNYLLVPSIFFSFLSFLRQIMVITFCLLQMFLSSLSKPSRYPDVRSCCERPSM